MKQVNDRLEFDIDTPSDEKLVELFALEERVIQAEREQRYKPNPPEYRGNNSEYHQAAKGHAAKRKNKRKAQRAARRTTCR